MEAAIRGWQEHLLHPSLEIAKRRPSRISRHWRDAGKAAGVATIRVHQSHDIGGKFRIELTADETFVHLACKLDARNDFLADVASFVI